MHYAQQYINLNILSTHWGWDNMAFPVDIFKCIFFNENVWILLKISLKFIPKVWINNIPALVLIMAWCRPADKPLSEPMMVTKNIYICHSASMSQHLSPLWIRAQAGLDVLRLSLVYLCQWTCSTFFFLGPSHYVKQYLSIWPLGTNSIEIRITMGYFPIK